MAITGTATPGEMLRTIGFAQTPGVLGILAFIPILGGIVSLVVFVWMIVAGVIAIRQALGSGRARIVRQLIVEGFALSVVGAALGVIVGAWTTRALAAWFGSALPLGVDVVIDPSSRIVAASDDARRRNRP